MATRGSFTCHDGWHVVARGSELACVHVGVRLRDAHGTYVYRVGPVPDEAACGTVWAYEGKGTPWTCSACGGPISGRRYNPYRPTQPASFEEALIEPFLHAVDPECRLDPATRREHATLAIRA